MARRRRRSSSRGRGCKGPVRSAIAKCTKRSGRSCSAAIKRASKSCVGYARTSRRRRGKAARRAKKNVSAAFGSWF